MKEWTPDFFVKHFGDITVSWVFIDCELILGAHDCQVKLQSSTFDTIEKTTIEDFIRTQFDGSPKPNEPNERLGQTSLAPGDTSSLNMRYQQPKGSVFDIKRIFGCHDSLDSNFFSVRAIQTLKGFWKAPSFLPWGGYSFPWTMFKAEQPNERWFHDWGIYLSPRGTVTRMHIDGTRTHAMLCMVSGQKKCYMLPPQCEAWFEAVYGSDEDPNHRYSEPCFQDLPQSMKDKLPMQALECTIGAGDVLFIPKNWLHEVHTTQSSVMITYNWLHGVADLCGSVVQQMWKGYAGTLFLNK